VEITLIPVTIDNWKACVALDLEEHQKGFISTNLYSIAEAQFYPDAKSRAIYNAENKLVGYALFGHDVFTGKWKIFRIMIDKSHQRKGYGGAAMREIIKVISEQPDHSDVLICYQNNNQVARRLYAKLGFIEQEIDDTGKVTASRKMIQVPVEK
jgi:diamine N-acetyltransferase